MNIKQDNRGLTLIELVIVMLISVILMGIAGTMIMSSSSSFHKTATTDLAKLSCDEISEFVREELIYAGDVVLSPTSLDDTYKKADGWHYFYISDVNEGRLYYDQTTTQLYSDGFYNNGKLIMVSKGYDNYQMDFEFSILDNTNQELYRTSESIELLNLKLKVASGATYFDDTTYDSRTKGYYLYYKKVVFVEKEEEEERAPGSGTVIDQLSCKDESTGVGSNNKGLYSNEQAYVNGDFVYLNMGSNEKIWYRCTIAEGKVIGQEPSGWATVWKEMNASFQQDSNYFLGDVVFFERMQVYGIYFTFKPWQQMGFDQQFGSNTSVWAPVYPSVYAPAICEIPWNAAGSYTHIQYAYIYNTPYAKLYPHNINLDKLSDRKKIMAYSDTKTYPSFNTFKASNPEDYIVQYNNEYYINVASSAVLGVKPGTMDKDTYVWQKLQTTWSANSAYVEGDIVISDDVTSASAPSRYVTYRAMQDVNKGGAKPAISAAEWGKNMWEMVYWNTTKNAWEKRTW